jgi:hypothetical protein
MRTFHGRRRYRTPVLHQQLRQRHDGVALELVGQNLGLPVVITRRGPGALLASSASSPAQLPGIDILP